jgi:hypothetical protein
MNRDSRDHTRQQYERRRREAAARRARLAAAKAHEARAVCKARGRFNRSATSEEHGILLAWAGQNGLEVSLGRWG